MSDVDVEETGQSTQSEEAAVSRKGPHGRAYHRQQQAVPGPRRKLKFGPAPVPQVAEEEPVAEASAEAEGFDEETSEDLFGSEESVVLDDEEVDG